MTFLFLLFLLGGPGSVLGSLSPNSVQEPSSLDPDFVYDVKDEELEEFCLPPSPVPHSVHADFAATVRLCRSMCGCRCVNCFLIAGNTTEWTWHASLARLGFRTASCATLPSSKTWRTCRWTRFVQQPVRW